jgi:probable F420-dependent oxidoreductase
MSDARALLGGWGVWSVLDHLGWPRVVDFARGVEGAGAGTLWVNETIGRDPFAVLAALAGVTERVSLGVGIASIYARDAVGARNAARTLAEVSDGRFVMGLGVSHRETVDALRGHRYAPPVEAMRAYLAAYRAAPYRGREPASEPPVVVAALGPRMLELAGAEADGAFPYFVPASFVPAARAQLDAAASGAGRSTRPLLVVTLPCVVERDPEAARRAARGYMDRHLGQANYRRSLARLGFAEEDSARPGSDALVDALVAWGTPDAIAGRVVAMRADGADHVCLIPLDRDGAQAHLPAIEALAPLLGPAR